MDTRGMGALMLIDLLSLLSREGEPAHARRRR